MSEINFIKEKMLLARLGEITLKGLNRATFEQRLFKNMRRRLEAWGKFKVHQSDSRVWIKALDEEAAAHFSEAMDIACRTFGIVSASPVVRYENYDNVETVCQVAVDYLAEFLRRDTPLKFKVESKRSNKRLPYNSPELCREVGAVLLDTYSCLSVDVHEPDFILRIELRDALYIYHEIVPGVRGLPVGTSAKAMLLLSGGIDSPVAGYMMASRGMQLEAIYFHTYPYTSDRAKEKVVDLAKILCDYCGRINLHVVDFTEVQLELRDKCPEDMLTIVMRRIMMRVAEKLALQQGCVALVTGESMGQVASQTAEALVTTDIVVERLPVFRPLIGLDKDDTIKLARQIGSFETSILPYEDCCTVFVAKHPRTRPDMETAIAAEANIDVDNMINTCLAGIECIKLSL